MINISMHLRGVLSNCDELSCYDVLSNRDVVLLPWRSVYNEFRMFVLNIVTYVLSHHSDKGDVVILMHNDVWFTLVIRNTRRHSPPWGSGLSFLS